YAELLAQLDDKLTATQRNWAGQAKMGKNYIALMFDDFFSFGIPYGKGNIAQRQPLEQFLANERLVGSQWNFGWIEFGHGMAGLFRPSIAVAGRSGMRHAFSADGDDNIARCKCLARFQQDSHDSLRRLH